MCLGVQYFHAGCNHPKKFMVIEACTFTNGITCDNPIIMHSSMVTAPSLCVRCFRQKEAMIDAEYETTKRELREEIARIDEYFAQGYVLTERASIVLQRYRAECNDNVLQAKASRNLSIRLFRQEQGVWGDG